MLVLLIILHIRFDAGIQMLEIRINPGSGAFADTVWMNSLLCLGGAKHREQSLQRSPHPSVVHPGQLFDEHQAGAMLLCQLLTAQRHIDTGS